MQKKIVLLLLAVVAFQFNLLAQSPSEKINPESFQPEFLAKLVLNGVNGVRWKAGMDSLLALDILAGAAQQMADDYAANKKAMVEPGLAGDVVKKSGGSSAVEDLGFDVVVQKSKQFYTYQEVADAFVDKLNKGKKQLTVLNNPKYTYTGVSCSIDDEGKKAYVSIVLGPIGVQNKGAAARKTLPVPFSKKKYGLDPYEAKICKVCDKFPEIDQLQQRLYVKDGKVYLESDDLKKLKKYLHGAHDGFAVDIIQKKQYPCDGDNIFDYNLNSKGIMLKPMYSAKIFKANEYSNPKENKYKGVVAKLSKKIVPKLGNDYELDLYYIVEGTICKKIIRKYLEDGGTQALTPLGVYPDTVMNGKRYEISSENLDLTFTVPFQQGKSTYDQSDIANFLNALGEPKYTINDISIEAHSSLEGDSNTNAKLQQKRAQSIADAIGKYSNKKFTPTITTDDSWDMFQAQVKGTEFEAIGSGGKFAAKDALRNGTTLSQLEPILSKERFALIKMKVTYDVSGSNEQPFVLSQYKKAVDSKKVDTAKMIQAYIIDNILKGRYDAKAFLAIDVPKNPQMASLLVNKVFVDNHVNHADSIYPGLQNTFADYYKTMADNNYVTYNKIMCDVKLSSVGDAKSIKETQKKIDAIYNEKNTPQAVVDNLNLEFQFRVISAVDTLDAGVFNMDVDNAMQKIKKIVNVKDATAESALKLAYIFVRHGDLKYSMDLLKPYVNDVNAGEQLMFTYISIAAQNQDNIFGRDFRLAMLNASKLNSTRFCNLFGLPYLSFQLMDNPLIKQMYCNTCGGMN